MTTLHAGISTTRDLSSNSKAQVYLEGVPFTQISNRIVADINGHSRLLPASVTLDYTGKSIVTAISQTPGPVRALIGQISIIKTPIVGWISVFNPEPAILGGLKTRPLLNISERTPDQNEMMRRNNDYLSQTIRVMLPAKVLSFDATKQTIVAQPLIREKVIDRGSGAVQWVTLPQLLDVPVCFPQGGNSV